MAWFKATTSTTAVDMGNLPYFDGRTIKNSTNNITVLEGSESYPPFQKQDYYGTFTYPQSGGVAGTVISTYYTGSDGLQYSFTDFSMDASTAFDLIGTRQIQQLESIILAGDDVIQGTFYSDNLYGFAGNDLFSGGPGNDAFDGGTGIDTVFLTGLRANSIITKTITGYSIQATTGVEGFDAITNVERLWFDDKAIAFDTDGNAGKAYRLYQAAFDRVPDLPGLGYWINILDLGYTMQNVASGFYYSTEFAGLYGTAPSNFDFLTRLYNNVLHRAPDQDGFNWWLNVLDSGLAPQQQVLIDFSESQENRAQVVGSIQNGIEYMPWTG